MPDAIPSEVPVEADELELGPDPTLLLVDDDDAFLRRLGRAMERRGFAVTLAPSVQAAAEAVAAHPPPTRWWTCGSWTATASTWSSASMPPASMPA